jgi:hypothetical protein
MRILKLTAALLGALSLNACGGVMIAADYDWVKQQEFPYQGTNWQILDRPKDSRMMIRPPLGQMMTTAPDQANTGWVAAGSAWLKSNGRNCDIIGQDKIVAQSVQLRYRCV